RWTHGDVDGDKVEGASLAAHVRSGGSSSTGRDSLACPSPSSPPTRHNIRPWEWLSAGRGNSAGYRNF
ncbi:unnamed protein product, partial [Urochloa humidicola]